MLGEGSSNPEPATTLYIDRSDSSCGACGLPAVPEQVTHDEVYGYNKGVGCGARFTHVSTHYMGMDDRVREMRPDLIFVAAGSEDPKP